MPRQSENHSGGPDFSWLADALIPGWPLFRQRFVEQSALVPVLVYGSLSQLIVEEPSIAEELFEEGGWWLAVDLQMPTARGGTLRSLPAAPSMIPQVWAEIEIADAVVASTDLETIVIVSGTDLSCILSTENRLLRAFKKSVFEMDRLIEEHVSLTLHLLDSRQLEPIDRLWLITFAWLKVMRLSEPPR